MAREASGSGNSDGVDNRMQLSHDLMRRFAEVNATADRIWGLSYFTESLVHRMIPACAASGYHVLIMGETGTGKELVAREIARHAGQIDRMISVNCAAISKSLAESELFGHVKGAFTGADKDRKGLFQEADQGILFLDEIGELPSFMQAKLLRAVQSGEVLKVGASIPEKVQVRLIAATNRPDRLRPDILWRFPEQIRMPSLRERFSDLFAVLSLLLKKAKDDGAVEENAYWVFSPQTIIRILYSPWPGNFRELENAANLSIARYRLSDEKANEVPFEFNLPTEERPEFRDYRLIAKLWGNFVKTVKQNPEHRKYVSEVEWARFASWGLLGPPPGWPSRSSLSGIGSATQPRVVEFSRAPENIPPEPGVQGQKPTPGLNHGKERRSTVECLSFGQFAVCHALTAPPYWHAQRRHNYPPVLLQQFSLEHARQFLFFLDPILQTIYELPKMELNPADPDLTAYSEAELLRVYYGQLRDECRTQKEIARVAGVSENAVARRLSRTIRSRKRD